MKGITRLLFFILCVVCASSFLPRVGIAQNTASTSLSVEEKQKQLEQELNGINSEIQGLSNTIGGLQTEKASIGRDISLLNANINKSTLNIKAKNLQISRLSDGIKDKSRTVEKLSVRLEREKQSLAQLIRKTNEIDQTTFVELMLQNDKISDALADIDSFDAIREGLKNSSDALKSAKDQTEQAKADLEEKQNEELNVKAELERNKRLVEKNEKEKQQLLKITKNKEKEYQTVLEDRKKRAAQIRAALFALRDSGEISFGRALEYANLVNQKTGVRQAFLLAIFQQESSFGKNQGSCFLKNKETGEGVSARTGNPLARVMKPDRDVTPYLAITAKVSRDPFNTRVSCPQEVGWGGAMGAAQFIPSTWVMYENKIAAATGDGVADPWNARDAFMAAGMYLKDIGGGTGTYSAERDAACKYFSGKKCSASAFAATYGNQVMSKATNIQENMIDPLQNT
jgi:membrane-bound lytic murein transglycosylase B